MRKDPDLETDTGMNMKKILVIVIGVMAVLWMPILICIAVSPQYLELLLIGYGACMLPVFVIVLMMWA